MKHIIIFLALLGIMISAKAQVPSWEILPEQSKLSFTATQNNAPVSGTFTHFTGDIYFSPTALDKSCVNIEVDTNSVTTSTKEVSDTLKTPDWFNIKTFPTAIFSAEKFTKTPDGKYQANGNLTIRDKTLPVSLLFTLKENAPDQMTANGSTTLKRTEFGVGQGEWSNTKDIKNEVNVEFTVVAKKKAEAGACKK